MASKPAQRVLHTEERVVHGQRYRVTAALAATDTGAVTAVTYTATAVAPVTVGAVDTCSVTVPISQLGQLLRASGGGAHAAKLLGGLDVAAGEPADAAARLHAAVIDAVRLDARLMPLLPPAAAPAASSSPAAPPQPPSTGGGAAQPAPSVPASTTLAGAGKAKPRAARPGRGGVSRVPGGGASSGSDWDGSTDDDMPAAQVVTVAGPTAGAAPSGGEAVPRARATKAQSKPAAAAAAAPAPVKRLGTRYRETRAVEGHRYIFTVGLVKQGDLAESVKVRVCASLRWMRGCVCAGE